MSGVEKKESLVSEYTNNMLDLLSQFEAAVESPDENDDPASSGHASNRSEREKASKAGGGGGGEGGRRTAGLSGVVLPEWVDVWKTSLDAMQEHGSPAEVSREVAGGRPDEEGDLVVPSSDGGDRGNRKAAHYEAKQPRTGGRKQPRAGLDRVSARVKNAQSAYAAAVRPANNNKRNCKQHHHHHHHHQQQQQRIGGNRGKPKPYNQPVLRSRINHPGGSYVEGKRSKSANVNVRRHERDNSRGEIAMTEPSRRPKTTQPVRPPVRSRMETDSQSANPDSPLKKAREAKRMHINRELESPEGLLDGSFESADNERARIARAISDLPENRKRHLLQMLEVAEKDLNTSVDAAVQGDDDMKDGGGGDNNQRSNADKNGVNDDDNNDYDDDEDHEYSDESDFEGNNSIGSKNNNSNNHDNMNSNGGAVDNNPGRASTKASYQEHLQQQIAPAEPIGLIKPPVPQLRPTLERIAGALGKVLGGAESSKKMRPLTKKFPPTKRTMLGPAALLEAVSRDLKVSGCAMSGIPPPVALLFLTLTL